MSSAEYSVYGGLFEQQLVRLAVEQSRLDAQVTPDPVGLSGSPPSYPWQIPRTWNTPLPYSITVSSEGDEDGLNPAIRSGDTEKVKKIVMSKKIPSLMRPNKDGWTALHEAAFYGQTDCLKLLLEAFPEMINIQTLKGQTPLILAVSRGHLDCMNYLLEEGADPRIQTKLKETPLYEACAACNAQMVLLLVKNGADIDQKCLDGWSSLHESVSQNNLEICQILTEYGAKICSPNKYGVTPLFLAAQCGCIEALKFLVKNGADINSTAKDGATALYEACKNGHREIVEFLLSQRADPDRPGKRGLLPLHAAAKNGHYGIISMLIPITSRTKIQQSGISPLHLAAEYNEDEVLELLIQAGFDVNVLLDPEHSCMYEDRRVSALYFAVDNDNMEAATMLLEAGANPNLDSFSPLLLAVRKGHVQVAALLLEHGANVNASIPTHPTTFPACVMLSVRNLTMLKCLMDYGSDATACFQCKYGFKEHPNVTAHSCLQFCEMISNPSVCYWAGPVVEMLLDYVGHVKLCSRLTEQLKGCDFWIHMKEKSSCPAQLMQLCRLQIRQQVGLKRLKCISTLTLPRRLIKYLNHEKLEDIL